MKAGDKLRFNIRLSQVPEYHPEPEPNPICTHSPDCQGCPYYAVGGQLCRYPKFIPEDYVILKLTPCRREGNWYRWDQEVPSGSSKELVLAAKEFSALKIGFRGDLAFKDVEVIDVPRFLCGEIVYRPEYAAFKNEEPSAPEMKMKL